MHEISSINVRNGLQGDSSVRLKPPVELDLGWYTVLPGQSVARVKAFKLPELLELEVFKDQMCHPVMKYCQMGEIPCLDEGPPPAAVDVLEVGLELVAGRDAFVVPDLVAVPAKDLVDPRVRRPQSRPRTEKPHPFLLLT